MLLEKKLQSMESQLKNVSSSQCTNANQISYLLLVLGAQFNRHTRFIPTLSLLITGTSSEVGAGSQSRQAGERQWTTQIQQSIGGAATTELRRNILLRDRDDQTERLLQYLPPPKSGRTQKVQNRLSIQQQQLALKKLQIQPCLNVTALSHHFIIFPCKYFVYLCNAIVSSFCLCALQNGHHLNIYINTDGSTSTQFTIFVSHWMETKWKFCKWLLILGLACM